MYSKTFFASWGDMDFNSHMAGPAFLYKCFDVRLMFFVENGFPMSEFVRLKLGPVSMKDDLEYFREVGLLQEITVNASVKGMSIDGSRWLIRQDVLSAEGKLCARLTSAGGWTGGWMDLAARKLIAPPEKLLTVFKSIIDPGDFTELPSSIKVATA
jgi:acyl-CoA thioester hydrolase